MNLSLAYALLIAGAAPPCVVKGRIDTREGLAVLHLEDRADTCIIHDGHFEFHPPAQPGHPELASLDIHPGGGTEYSSVPVILEPGEIRVAEAAVPRGRPASARYQTGGTPDNEQFQQIRNRLAPFRDSLDLIKHKAYQAQGDEQSRLLKEVDRVFADEAQRAFEEVKDNQSFAGLAELSMVYRKATLGDLTHFLEEFRRFDGDPLYKRLEDFFSTLPRAETGLPAPSFSLVSKEGSMVPLSSFKGKYVLLDFWFHNCTFCRQMAPTMVKLYAELKDKGFEIVSISVDAREYEHNWREAIGQDKSTWTELWDYNSTLPKLYGVSGYPTMFLLDGQGIIREKILGLQQEETLRKLLADYIH